MGWGNKGIEIRSVETGQMDGIFMHKKTQKLRFLCERNDKVSGGACRISQSLTRGHPPPSSGLLCFHKVLLKLPSLLHGPQPTTTCQIAHSSQRHRWRGGYFHNTCLYIHLSPSSNRPRLLD